jgi:DNA-binding transcriptional ArsR family regulator
MLDQLRRNIQARLDELLSEADKLRHALTALTSHDDTGAPKSNGGSSRTPSQRGTRPAPATPTPDREPARRRRSAKSSSPAAQPAESHVTARPKSAAAATARTAPGATKTAVLAALANGSPMTAGEVASATGLGRASVSTTLAKLAKSGEVTKAPRGYQVAGQPSAAPPVTTAASAQDGQPVT